MSRKKIKQREIPKSNTETINLHIKKRDKKINRLFQVTTSSSSSSNIPTTTSISTLSSSSIHIGNDQSSFLEDVSTDQPPIPPSTTAISTSSLSNNLPISTPVSISSSNTTTISPVLRPSSSLEMGTTTSPILQQSSLIVEVPDGYQNSRCRCKNAKSSNYISFVEYQKLQQQNDQLKLEINKLKQEIHYYNTTWMPLPTGEVSLYFKDVYKRISDNPKNKEETDKQQQTNLEPLSILLNTNQQVLNDCKGPTITRTCRQIVKKLYKNKKERSEMFISLLPDEKLKAIRKAAILLHPEQADIPNYVLNNAIGNVFSSEKEPQKTKKKSKKKIVNQTKVHRKA